MTNSRRLILLACACAALALPAGAQAATAEVVDVSAGAQRVDYAALDGERNQLEVSYEASTDEVLLTDNVDITPGPGCRRDDAGTTNQVVCTLRRPATPGIVARLDDGDDEANVSNLSARLFGEDGNDTLQGGDEQPNFLSGGNDVDRLSGGTERDRISGGFDIDVIHGSAGPDRLNGGPGSDVIKGGGGRDRITGGRGTDKLLGQGGGDRIFAKEDLVDDISCGGGRDRVQLDGFDQMSGSLCERAPREFPPSATPIAASFDGGSVDVLLGCSRDGPARCEGTVSVKRGGTDIAGTAIEIRRGRKETVRRSLSSEIRQEIEGASSYFVTVVVRSKDALDRTRIIRVRFDLAS